MYFRSVTSQIIYNLEASSDKLAAFNDRGVDNTADEAEHGEGAEDGRSSVALLGVAGGVVDLLLVQIAAPAAVKATHRVEDAAEDPREGTSSRGLGVEQTQEGRRGENEGDTLERVLVGALGAVELLWGCQRVRHS